MISFVDLSSFDSGNEPPTLLQQCFHYVAENLETICDKTNSGLELSNGVVLPREICDRLLAEYQQKRKTLDDEFASVFKNNERTKLTRVSVKNSGISDDGLAMLVRHQLEILDLRKCSSVSFKSLDTINQHGNKLRCLVVGDGVHLFPERFEPGSPDAGKSMYQSILLNTPNLRSLAIHNMPVKKSKPAHYFLQLLSPLQQLQHLDLSGCRQMADLARSLQLASLDNLKSLILHNTKDATSSKVVTGICSLRNLEVLDISQFDEREGKYEMPDLTLATIVKSLPKLKSLDISGTNLAGTGVADAQILSSDFMKKRDCDENFKSVYRARKSDIAGLSSRADNPLEFLGLYGTDHKACYRHDIPASLISGDATECQLVTAALKYIDRPIIIQRVLSDLYHRFRNESISNVLQVLSIILSAMDRHISERNIQISGSAIIFYIVKIRDKVNMSVKTKRHIITALLNAMDAFADDDTMMRNGCLVLSHFKIPKDVIFEYKRLATALILVVAKKNQDIFVRRISIYLLNSLACQVSEDHKELLGQLGAISWVLEIINEKLSKEEFDDVLDVAWSIIWNVTDETPLNSERFLNKNGMDLFLGCLEAFPDKEQLLRNMIGLIGNVAEVKHLRPRLMQQSYVKVFCDLVNSQCDGIEVSYNAAGVLSHLASDGPEAWTIESPTREEVLRRIVEVVDTWDLNLERNINYRSFHPILRLAQTHHIPQCQHWAVWALANLTKVYPDKYCSLVEQEGGIEILQKLINDDGPFPRSKELARMVLTQCQESQNRREYTSDYD
ncbi:unnamed protein product [Bemisia tabaci]|uniref:Protein zer-1 homolog n=1 Tax=Bemisia tabaci TaxID=7038 RepID=A0A9P0AIC9_BEMTA|nr:PREDICTED: protein zer-1 homolog [Bemisia tabaci]CAH0392441.1 unnamed protein product [Bemisia tabaci]